jgi:hypothetical protein
LQGKADRSVLEAAQRAQEEEYRSGLPTEVVNRRKEFVYEHKPGLLPGERWAGGHLAALLPSEQASSTAQRNTCLYQQHGTAPASSECCCGRLACDSNAQTVDATPAH